MILKRLFRVYKRGAPGPCFGSRFASKVGKLCIGTVQQRGLGDALPELQQSYYWRQADRHPPKDKLPAWFSDSQKASDVRVSEEPVVAKAGALVAILAGVILVGGSALIKKPMLAVTCSGVQEDIVAAVAELQKVQREEDMKPHVKTLEALRERATHCEKNGYKPNNQER